MNTLCQPKKVHSLIFRKILKWAESNQQNYSEDYFEKQKWSCYKDYSWKPKIIFPRVAAIIKYADLKPGQKILDYGCAKGFYVKRFCELNYDAIGVDISKYALSRNPPEIKKRLFELKNFPLETIGDQYFDLTLAKDVLEHIPPFALKFIVKQLKRISKKLLVVVPFCQKNGGQFFNPEDEKDKNHLIRLSSQEWKKIINGVENRSLCQILKGEKSKGSLCLIFRQNPANTKLGL